MGTSPIPISLLHELFLYRSTTGAFLWRATRKPAGSTSDDGYRVVKVKFEGRRVQIAVHKAIFAMRLGRYPEGDVDHRDTNRQNNRWRNLREATRSKNLANRRQLGKLPKGVAKSGRKNKPFKAQITIEGKTVTIGRFPCKKTAHAAYMIRAREIHGEYARAR